MKLELPGKGPVAKVHLTFTFRPTEGLHDSASNIERDAFGFEIAPLQRDTYRAHKDVLQKIGKDDRERIDALLETGLHMNHQQVCSLRLFCRYFPIRNIFVSSEHYVLCLRCVHHSHAICSGMEACRHQGCSAYSSWRSMVGIKSAQAPFAPRAHLLQVSDFFRQPQRAALTRKSVKS